MVAMGGPLWSFICDCHSFRNRSAARYSVRVSVKVPVTCRVTIFTPFTETPGDVSVVTNSSIVASGILICFFPSRRGKRDWEFIVLRIAPKAEEFNALKSCAPAYWLSSDHVVILPIHAKWQILHDLRT